VEFVASVGTGGAFESFLLSVGQEAVLDPGERVVKLNRRDLVRIFFRSFMIQGLWTVQRAQNLGYIYSLWPVFRRLHPRREERARAARARR
jgi:hypothetical protein